MRSTMWFVSSGVAALALAVIFALPREAQSQKDEARVAAIAQIMAGINSPRMKIVGAVAKKAPASDEEWEEIELSAALLNEVGFLLMQNSRCPDGVWAGACAELRTGAAEMVKAAGAKDFDAAQAACGTIGGACKSCHDQHRKKK